MGEKPPPLHPPLCGFNKTLMRGLGGAQTLSGHQLILSLKDGVGRVANDRVLVGGGLSASAGLSGRLLTDQEISSQGP